MKQTRLTAQRAVGRHVSRGSVLYDTRRNETLHKEHRHTMHVEATAASTVFTGVGPSTTWEHHHKGGVSAECILVRMALLLPCPAKLLKPQRGILRAAPHSTGYRWGRLYDLHARLCPLQLRLSERIHRDDPWCPKCMTINGRRETQPKTRHAGKHHLFAAVCSSFGKETRIHEDIA